ncbi:MAG: aldo/keto reductase [Lentisphaerae bacterium]|nr:aldo/keto reductase [Lentisphaerota bacterium]
MADQTKCAVSKLIFGTMSLGDVSEPFDLLDAAWNMGCNAFDLAHVYGRKPESTFGNWLSKRVSAPTLRCGGVSRASVFIIGKGGHSHVKSPKKARLSEEDITKDLNESLERINIDYFDLYLLHRDDPSQPVGPIVETFNELLTEGKLRAFGVSNWHHTRIQEANEYAVAKGLVPFAISSPHFSLAEQVGAPWGPGCVALSGPKEAEARTWYERTGLAVFPYSSLARGFFSGRLKSTDRQGFEEIVDAPCQRAYCFEVNFQRLERVEQLAAEAGYTVAQIALAYVVHQPMHIHPLVGAAKRAEIESCIAALDLEFSQSTLDWLDLRTETR